MTLCIALSLALSRTAWAQTPTLQQMSAEERAAYLGRLRAAAEADRRLMLSRLGIHEPDSLPPAATDPNRPGGLVQRAGSSNWYDAAGNTYVRSPWGIWSNYDEARAGGDRLPDPLMMNDGTRVADAASWWSRRRPELLELFQRDVYGRIPASVPSVTFDVVSVDSTTFTGVAVVKHVVGHVAGARPGAAPKVDITMYLPPQSRSRVPIVTMVGFFFGRAGAGLPESVTQVLALGWAFATVNTGTIQADNGAGLSEGIIGLVNGGRPREPDEWGVLAAWSWGMSRALDYFETDPAIDPRRAAIQGHSRWGKTALLAGALDQRWAIVWPSCSGAMGASLEKRNWGENIDNVAGSGEYHWMAGNFLEYAGHWEQMPVDAHELIALVAPRPVFITGGTTDQWSDPHGEFLAAVAAEPVYLGTTVMPAPDVALIDGELAFRDHEGGHTDAPDWPTFLRFARRYFDRPTDGTPRD
jgi:hypothetical protein